MVLPTYKLGMRIVSYNLHLRGVTKVIYLNFRVSPHYYKQWRSVGRVVNCMALRLSVHVRGTSFVSFSACSKNPVIMCFVICLFRCLTWAP